MRKALSKVADRWSGSAITRAMAKLDSPLFAGDKPPLALIAGPTASGKSDVAVKLALYLQEHGQEAAIVNADSAQVYRDLRILSARPDSAEMQGIAHHLFGEWDGAVACSAADWAARARQVIADLHARQIVPILVGGTGLYMRVLLEGIAPIPPIDPDIRACVRALDQATAYAALQAEDAEAAAKLSPADNLRTTRALEVIRSTGRSIIQWRAKKAGGIGDRVDLRPAILLPERQWLYERCDRRFAQMLDIGGIAEAEELLARHLNPDLPVMRAIGVREIAAWLSGRNDQDAMIDQGQQATRNYAKRQYTWFRKQPPADWHKLTEYENLDWLKVTLFQELAR